MVFAALHKARLLIQRDIGRNPAPGASGQIREGACLHYGAGGTEEVRVGPTDPRGLARSVPLHTQRARRAVELPAVGALEDELRLRARRVELDDGDELF